DPPRPAGPQELSLLPQAHLPAVRGGDARPPLLLDALRPGRGASRRVAGGAGPPRTPGACPSGGGRRRARCLHSRDSRPPHSPPTGCPLGSLPARPAPAPRALREARIRSGRARRSLRSRGNGLGGIRRVSLRRRPFPHERTRRERTVPVRKRAREGSVPSRGDVLVGGSRVERPTAPASRTGRVAATLAPDRFGARFAHSIR